MRFTKEMLAAKKESIRRGMILTADCPVTTPFAKSAPASDLSEIRKRIDALAVKIAETARRQRACITATSLEMSLCTRNRGWRTHCFARSGEER